VTEQRSHTEMKSPQAIAAEIAAELRKNPGDWTQFSYARNDSGQSVTPRSSDATQWCALGMCRKHYGTLDDNPLRWLLEEILGEEVHEWNDRQNRKVSEVIELFERAAAYKSDEQPGVTS
jgi:hypothetical protein